ncbi:hypothetical protein EWE75_23630 [Sphingomonas populi]|uniref:Uncharacterized protein n=1 Tax=Sphingomonas populi TaxID=2484750 RepID=A0A4V2DBT3_9SPHN|nr:hypothetical protein [Sphingomonas populi]RZF59088.1 hypothetical protein EWE75_23630 [Sphingomonas populi]
MRIGHYRNLLYGHQSSMPFEGTTTASQYFENSDAYAFLITLMSFITVFFAKYRYTASRIQQERRNIVRICHPCVARTERRLPPLFALLDPFAI